MANNKTKNTTIPLKAHLNMTGNKSIISSSFDMLEDNNSPVYGGCIYPLHTQLQYNDNLKRKWDKLGNYYYVRNNTLYKNGQVLLDTGNITFNVTEYKTFEVDGVPITPEGGYFYNGNVFLYGRKNTNFYVQMPNGGILDPGNVKAFTVRNGLMFSIEDISFVVRSLETGAVVYNNSVATMHRFKYMDTMEDVSEITTDIMSGPQIIVSNPVDGLLGVTVLSSRQKGTNPYATCLFKNMIIRTDGSGVKGDVLISCGNNQDYWGIFHDESNLVYEAFITQEGTWMGPWAGYMGNNLYRNEWIGRWESASQLSDNKLNTTEKCWSLFWGRNGFAYCSPGDVCAAGLTTNQRHHRFLHAGDVINGAYINSDGTSVTMQFGGSVLIDSGATTYPEGVDSIYPFFMSGFMADFTIPSNKEGWAGIWNQTQNGASNTAIYNPTGSCTNVGNWRMLYNYRQGYLTGISYTGGTDAVGTLVTPWNSVDESSFVQVNGNSVLYKDITTNSVKRIDAVAFDNSLDRVSIVEGRYVVVNCHNELNSYDVYTDTFGNWASDWNNRIFLGHHLDNGEHANGSLDYYKNRYMGKWMNTATSAAAQNMGYAVTKAFTPSAQFPYNTLNKVIAEYTLIGAKSSRVPIDIYIGKNTLNAPSYVVSYWDGWKGGGQYNSALDNTTYPVSSSSSVNYNLPIVGWKAVDGYAGRFGLTMGKSSYSIRYDGIRPIASYNALSALENVDCLFIIQSQYYAVSDGFIVAITYNSSNAISSVEQIVDVTGMAFIGAFPSVAYFWSPATHSIFAFTGDADLQLFVQSNRLQTVSSYCYSPENEWIYINTNDGLYVMTQMNIFRITDFKDIDAIYATDDGYTVLERSNTTQGFLYNYATKLKLDKSNFDTLPIHYRTAYFGPGDNKTAVVDCWYIRLWKGDEPNNGYLKAKVHTLTDTTFVSDEREWQVTSDMWDDNDTLYIRYQPSYQLSQGTALELTSDYPIASIGFSIQDEGTAQVSNANF